MTDVPFDLSPLSAAGFGFAPLAGTVTAGTVTPAPPPGSNLREEIDPGDVSPGLLGFLPVFLIALACIGLFLSLTSKLRKVNRRQERLDAEEAAAAGPPAAGRPAAGTVADTSVDARPDDPEAR